MQKTYCGKLTLAPDYLDTAGVLYLSSSEEWNGDDLPLAEIVSQELFSLSKKPPYRFITVLYWFSPSHPDIVIHWQSPIHYVKKYEGIGYARYQVFYDEWEDSTSTLRSAFDGCIECFNVTDSLGNIHDLLPELKAHVGQYLYMEVTYADHDSTLREI